MQNSNIKNLELIHDIVPLLLLLVLDNHSRIVDVGVCAMMMALGFERTLRHTPIKLPVILAIRCSISPARYARGVGSLPKTKEDRALIRAARGWEPRSCYHSVCVALEPSFNLALRLRQGTRPAANNSRSRHR